MKISKSLLPAAALVALFASCQDEDFGYQANDIKYEKEFAKTFGEINPDQDWTAAARYSAKVDLSGISSSVCDVLVFNGQPRSGGELAAHFVVDGSKEFNLDLPKNTRNAFVVIADKEGNVLFNQYVPVVDGVINIASDVTRATTTDVVPTLNLREVPQVGVVAYNDLNTPLHPEKGEYDSNFNYGFSVYYLDNDAAVKNGESANTVKDMAVLVCAGGTKTITTPSGYTYDITYDKGYFGEGSPNREIYKDIFSKDVVLTTVGGEVSIANEFGGTDYTNQFGYYYYYEGADATETLKNKIAAKKYVAIRRSEPGNNIVIRSNGTDKALSSFDGNNNGGMALPNQVLPQYMGKSGVKEDDLIVGTKYRLVYFEEGKDPSYNFPAGLKVGFFYKTLYNYYHEQDDDYVLQEKDGYNIKFSDSELNKYYGKLYDQTSNLGDWKAVSYTIRTTTEITDEDGTKRTITAKRVIAGFEDGTDNDLNDLLFAVEGVEEDQDEIEIKSPKQTWVIASEDLGGVYDYDFNDVVFSVKHVAGESKAVVTPLASGGTLPVYIYYTDASGAKQKVGGKEFHKLFSEDAPYGTQINAESRGTEGEGVEITVGSDFSLSYNDDGTYNLGGFDVHAFVNPGTENEQENETGNNAINGFVKKGDKTKGKTPQMLLIHDVNFGWPKEEVSILEAYPDFASYVSNPAENCKTWFNAAVTDKCVARGNYNPIIGGGEGGSTPGGDDVPAWVVKPILVLCGDLEMTEGDAAVSKQLTYGKQIDGKGNEFTPGNSLYVTMVSSNTSVATVDFNTGSGYYTITPVGKGECTITVTHAAVPDVYQESVGEIKVTVKELVLPIPQFSLKIGDIDLEANGYSVGLGAADTNFDIEISKGSMGDFEVTSSNTDVAAIMFNSNEGTGNYYQHSIRAKSIGTTTITVKHKLVAGTWAEETKTFKFTVTKPIPAFTLQANGAEVNTCTLYVGETFNFSINQATGASGVTYTCSSSDDTKASVSLSGMNGTITANAAGTATITVTYPESDDYAETSKTIVVTVKPEPEIESSTTYGPYTGNATIPNTAFTSDERVVLKIKMTGGQFQGSVGGSYTGWKYGTNEFEVKLEGDLLTAAKSTGYQVEFSKWNDGENVTIVVVNYK